MTMIQPQCLPVTGSFIFWRPLVQNQATTTPMSTSRTIPLTSARLPRLVRGNVGPLSKSYYPTPRVRQFGHFVCGTRRVRTTARRGGTRRGRRHARGGGRGRGHGRRGGHAGRGGRLRRDLDRRREQHQLRDELALDSLAEDEHEVAPGEDLGLR